MKKYFLILVFLLPFFNWGQTVLYTEDWDTASQVGWTLTRGQNFNLSADVPCGGQGQSARVRLIGSQSSTLRSPYIGIVSGGEIDFSFDYKWLVYNANMSTPVAGAAGELSLRWQWANSSGGPWYTFETIDYSNHTANTTCSTITSTFTPYPGQFFVRVIVNSLGGDNYLYLDNINVTQRDVPPCLPPRDIYIFNQLSDGFSVAWTPAPGQAAASYEWELRTAGKPGSGVTGLTTDGTTPASTINIPGLTPQTSYFFYIRSVCGGANSDWIGFEVYTLCDIPDFTAPRVDICGVQDVDLQVDSSVGGLTSFWFGEPDVPLRYDEELKFQGSPFSHTDVSEPVSYRVFAGISNAGHREVLVGGAATITEGVPFTASKANKVQYIYQAEEMKAAGFTSGIIKGFGFEIGINGGLLVRRNFEVSMGFTRMEDFGSSDEFIPQGQLQVVKNLGDRTFMSDGRNMLSLDNPIIWDGYSNVVVQIVYSDLAITPFLTAFRGVTYQSSDSYRTITASSETNDFNQMKAVASGTRSYFNIAGIFEVLDGCFGMPQTATIDFFTPPPLVLSDTIVNNCQGQPLQKVYVLTGAGDYDTYEWEPDDPNDPNNPNNASIAISGDYISGWTFNPATPTTYTLKASNSTGLRCAAEEINVQVDLSPSPVMALQLSNNYNLCADNVQELRVDNFIDEHPVEHLFNSSNLSGASIANAISGDAISNSATLFSEGDGSLKISYAAQTNAVVNFDSTINMNNLKSIVVEFDHIAALQAAVSSVEDYAYVEYTTDNGVTWNPFLPTDYTGGANPGLPTPVGQSGFQGMFFTKTSYSEWVNLSDTDVPSNTMWKSEKFVVPASEFTGTGTFKIRLRIGSDGNTQYNGWYVDNLRITPISNYQVTWSPMTDLYYDQNATESYDGTINVGKVYFKSSSIVNNRDYNVTITNQYGCSVDDDFKVSVGLEELPGITNPTINRCGPLDVANTGFTKNTNGTLYYYDSPTSTSRITQISTSGVYYVEQEIVGCKSQRLPFTVNIAAKPSIPSALTSQSFCGGATVDDLQYNSVSGFQIKWYLSNTGGTALLPSASLANGGTYYAEFDNGICVSDSRARVDVTVGIIPPAVSVNDVYICGTSTVGSINVSTAPGASAQWYRNQTDVNPLSASTVLSTGTYYVAQKVGACESPKTAVNVTAVQNLTAAPNAAPQTFCGSATIGDLVATGAVSGAVVNWYSFGTSDTPLSPTDQISSGTYYVDQSIGDCHSPKRPVSVRIISVNAPVINPISICGGVTVATLPLSSTPGTSYRVYDTSFATVEMNQNDIITSGTYYISRVEAGCETDRTAVNITVIPKPATPTGDDHQSFENQAQVSDLKTNENNVIWFESYNDALNNTNQLPSYIPLQNGKAYYAVIIGPGGCLSDPFKVDVTITLGTNNFDLASLSYFPNPAETEVTVIYKEAIRSIEVYDLTGKQVKVQQFEANEVRIDVSSLSTGTYMMKVQTETGSQFVKIAKR